MTLVEFRNVHFAYPARENRPAFAIRDLSFSVEPGEIFGLIGPNASGKTTVIRLLSKVVAPSRGEIRVEGDSLGELSRAAIATRVAVVPQSVPRGFPYTVGELILMGRFPHAPRRFFESEDDVGRARRAMEATGVLSFRDAPMDDLSEGERQRVMLARALCQGSPLLVLDEPTAHLDLRHQAEFVDMLRRFRREERLTVILICHDLNLAAELCDRLLLMRAGTAVGLGPVEAVLEEETLQSVYGCRLLVDKHPSSRRPTVQVVWPDP